MGRRDMSNEATTTAIAFKIHQALTPVEARFYVEASKQALSYARQRGGFIGFVLGAALAFAAVGFM